MPSIEFMPGEDATRRHLDAEIASERKRIDALNQALMGNQLNDIERQKLSQELHEATQELRGYEELLEDIDRKQAA